MTTQAPTPVLWTVDPDDPRAPPLHIWNAMSPAERKRVVEALPSEFPISEALPPPEGDLHWNAKVGARDVLGGYFQRLGRRVYIASELPVYYAGERMFAPDVFAVLDVDPHERENWTVESEGKGLDLAIEIVVHGRRRKDLQTNVERYARLGISEYFVFDRGRLKLTGYRLPRRDGTSGQAAGVYEPISGRAGALASNVLGLEVRLEGTRLRFYHAGAALPDSNELIRSLERMVDDVEDRLAAAEERAAEEARLREEAEQGRASAELARLEAERSRTEAERSRAEAERKLAEALAEIARLKAEHTAK